MGQKEALIGADLDPKTAMADAIDGASCGECEAEERPPWRPVRASNPKPRKPELIHGLLRRGHTMIISGKGKIGKTYLCIQLAVCVAFGLDWFGAKCEQGRTLLINPEVDEDSFDGRVSEVCMAMGVDREEADRLIDVWTTRRDPVAIDEIIERFDKFPIRGQYSLIVLDSVSCYVAEGESEADKVRKFTGKVNSIAEKANASVLMVHHYGKGNQGERDAGDRARGSSVWLDAPDTALTLTELYPPSGEVEDYLDENQFAFRVECAGIREFGPFKPVNVIRRQPLIYIDNEGTTSDWRLTKAGAGRPGGEAKAEIVRANRERDFAIYQNSILAELIQREDGDQGITCKEAAELLGIDGKASQKLNNMFVEFGEPEDYVEGDFTTKAYHTALLTLRKKPSPRTGKASQSYYIIPRFKVGQLELDIGD